MRSRPLSNPCSRSMPAVHPAVAEPSELGTSLSGNRSGHRAIPLPASAGSLEPIHCTRSHSLVLRLAGCLTRRAAVSHFGLCSAWRRPPGEGVPRGGGRPALHRAARRAAPSGDAPRKGAQALAACAGRTRLTARMEGGTPSLPISHGEWSRQANRRSRQLRTALRHVRQIQGETPAILILAFSPLNWTGLPVDLARIGSETRGAMRLTAKPDAKTRTAGV